MRFLTAFLLSLCFALPSWAEKKQSFGELDVHYSVFNSSFLQPDIAASVGLTRSKRLGVLNISTLYAGKPVVSRVSGEVKDLLGKRTPLTFTQVKEENAVYYLAQFPITGQEILQFYLDVQGPTGPTQRVQFKQEVFPDL